MLEVLYEDNHLLAVNKPALLPTMGVAEDRPSLLTLAKLYIRRKYSKPGNVYLGIVSRLDAPVTGVALLARTSKAASRLAKQFRDRDVEKVYWALVTGRVDPPAGRLVGYLRKDERHRRMHMTRDDTGGAQWAALEYRLLEEAPGVPRVRNRAFATLLEVRLETGRKHQIRVQLAGAGFPIVGDRKYGSDARFAEGIALHSRRVVFEHPVQRIPLSIEAPLPASWRKIVDAADGA